ncbi:MAG: DHA2 family efflux MFS transporter permease subunit [Chlamydiota bacterium]
MTEKPLAGSALYLGVISLALCAFMQILDTSIANVSIPYIAGDLGTSTDNGTWVITMFAVGNAISLPLTGWFTKRLGSIKTTLLSTGLFTVTSWLCGVSWSMDMLVILRFIQGFVAGPLIPMSQSLMIISFPAAKKNLALALWNMVVVVAPVLGPILGGWITYDYSWPWIFFINVPVGIFCTLIIWNIYREYETPKVKAKVDAVGIFLLACGVSSLQILLDRGQDLDWWRSNTVWLLTIVAVISLAIFVIWELTDSDPIIDFQFFTNRNFTIGVIVTALSFMLLFAAIVISPLWLQTGMGYTSLWAGIAVSPLGIFPFFSVLFVAKLMGQYPLRYLIMFGFVCYSLALFYFTTFTTAVSIGQVAFSRLLFGIGISVYLAPLTAVSFAHFPASKLASGQGVFHFFRIFMGGIGASAVVTIWERRTTHHHQYLVDSINPYHPISQELFSTLKDFHLEGKAALTVVDDLVWQQSYILSVNDVFWLSGWIFLILIVPLFFFKRRKKLVEDVAQST